MSRRVRALAALLGSALTWAACAAPPPPSPGAPPAAAGAPGPSLQPPPFAAGAAPSTPEASAAARAELRRAILDAAWRTVRDNHYDKTLGGVDWAAVRA